ncbi:MAG: substrate-binding domain-containing protein, partial [Acetobacteraceae bacterium]|nr:substrate-binding domain-containing protein [Acetobacteraceae bacterium]
MLRRDIIRLGVTATAAAWAIPRVRAQGTPRKAGFAQSESNNPWRIAETKSMQEEAQKRGWQLVYTDAASSAAKQVSDVNSMIAQGVDIIFLVPREERPLIPAVRAAKQANIPVILIDRSVDPTLAKAGTDYLTFIGSNFVEEGHRVGDWLTKRMNGTAKIIQL